MKWTTATALFLALSASGLGVAVVLNREPKSPSEVLAEVKAEMGRASFDKKDALGRLERALDDPRATADPVLATELYRTRAGLFRELRAFDLARADLETLLTTYRRGDRDLELEILRLQARDGQVVNALQRTRSLLQREPDFSDGWALRGELETAAADKKLEEASLVVDRSLAQIDARAAKEVLVKLTARDVEDPGRDFLVKQLRDLFSSASGTDLNQVLQLVNEPRSGYKRARAAFARAMTSSMAASTVIALANSFERAGRDDLGIQLHTAARSIESIRTNPEAVSAYLTDLARSNRIIEARGVVQAWDWQLGGTREFYRSSGEVLYKAKEYGAFGQVSRGLVELGADSGRVWSWFYSSINPIANADAIKKRAAKEGKLPEWDQSLRRAVDRLKQFIEDTQEVEPFFGAKDDALFWIAEGYRALGQIPNEQVFLRRALNANPRYSAEAWVRLAETLRQSKQGVPWEDVEEALTMALQLAPERTPSLAPLWYEAGERALAKRGLTVEQVIDEVARARRTVPNRPVGTSVMTQLAASHLENGREYAAIRAAKEALAKYRDLVPPLDIIISAELREPNLYSPEKNIIRRIEAAGIDSTVEGFMAQLPAGQLEGEALVRAIRAAPARFGKAAVARYYFDLNEPERAVAALAGIDEVNAPGQLRVLRAQLLIQSGEWDAAITELRRAEADPMLTGQSLLLQIRTLIGADQLRALDPVVARLEASQPATSRLLLDAADSLSAAGRADLAKRILDRMDQDMEARTPAFYRRRVLVDVLTSGDTNTSEAQESILRAEAYLEDGTPEIGALLLAVKERKWTELPDLIARLSESKFQPNPYEDAALALLGERLESGQRAIRAGLARSPRNPHWGFLSTVAKALSDDQIDLPEWFGPDAGADAALMLRGNDQRTPQDPRDALVLYLVSNDLNWSPWVLPGLRELETSTQSKIWTRWLRLLVLDVRGESRDRDALLQKLTRTNPRFGPGHDLAVTAAEQRNPTEPLHPELVRARRVRLASLGEDLVADPIEIGLARAGELARQGNYIEATRALKPVVQAGGPRQTEGMLMLGILMIRADQPSLAAQYLYEAAQKGPGVFQDVVIDSLLFSIRHAIETADEGTPQRGALTKIDALNMLDGLTRRYPLDPMVALARLEFLELGEGERGARAAGILQRLFRDSGGKTLDQLRRGSARRWVEFLAPIASDVAKDLVSRDLESEPGNLELWQLGGYVAEVRGETAEARGFYRALMAIDPRARTGYALAAILIEEGAPLPEVYDIILKASRAQGGGSSRATFLRSVAEMRIPRPNLDMIIGRLEGLWLSRERTQREVDPIQLGLLYADALTQRGEPGDLAKLGQLLTELRPMTIGALYEADMVEALDGLRRAVLAANEAASKAAAQAGAEKSDSTAAGSSGGETAKAQ